MLGVGRGGGRPDQRTSPDASLEDTLTTLRGPNIFKKETWWTDHNKIDHVHLENRCLCLKRLDDVMEGGSSTITRTYCLE